MNAKPILLFVLLVILILLGFGTQVFLTRTLNDQLTRRVIPEIEAKYGLIASYDTATLDLLKRRVDLGGLTVRNPDGFRNPTLLTADNCSVIVELKSLIKRAPLIIKRVQVDGATLTIERNKERLINVQEISGSAGHPLLQKRPTGAPTAMKQPETALEKVRTAIQKKSGKAIQFRRIEMNGAILYDDRARSQDYLFNVELAANNLFTVPATNQPSTLVTLRGALASNPDEFATDLNAFIEPLTHLETPTFNATGSIENIDPELIKKELRKNKMESGAFSIKPSIACKKGMLDGSSINVQLRNLKVYDSKIGDTTLSIPVQGPLMAPTIDLTGVLQSLFSENAGNLLNALIQKNVKPEKKKSDEKPDGKPAKDASVSDVLVDKLGGSVKEIDGNEDLKKSLRELGNSLFGD